MRLSVSLAITVLLFAAANSNAYADRDGKGGRGGDRDRDIERSDRDRDRDHDREIRDSERLIEREIRESDSGKDTSGSRDRDDIAINDQDRSSADEIDGKDIPSEFEISEASVDGDSGLVDSIDNNNESNSGSGSSESGSSDSDSSGSGSSGSSNDDDNDNSGSGNSNDDDNDDDDDDDDNSGPGNSNDDDDDDEEDGEIEYDDNGHAFRDREIIVLADDAGTIDRSRARGFTIVEERRLDRVGSVVVRMRAPKGMRSSQALDIIRQSEPNAASGYNHIYTPFYRQSGDPTEFLSAPEINLRGLSKTAASVAIIDGFSADTIAGYSVTPFIKARAHAGHGDLVSSILLQGLSSYAARAPADLILADVVEPIENSGPGASVMALVDALDWSAKGGALVINLSLAGPDNPALRRAIARLSEQGVVIVAAVGNEGPAVPPGFPASYEGVFGVSAVDAENKPYLYAARGEHVDFTAPGVDIVLSPDAPAISGTSYAAPKVAALAASLVGDYGTDDIEFRLSQLATDLGVPGKDPVYGHGILTLQTENRQLVDFSPVSSEPQE